MWNLHYCLVFYINGSNALNTRPVDNKRRTQNTDQLVILADCYLPIFCPDAKCLLDEEKVCSFLPFHGIESLLATYRTLAHRAPRVFQRHCIALLSPIVYYSAWPTDVPTFLPCVCMCVSEYLRLCSCVCVCLYFDACDGGKKGEKRERESARKREREREGRHTHAHTQREIERERGRDRDRESVRAKERENERESEYEQIEGEAI